MLLQKNNVIIITDRFSHYKTITITVWIINTLERSKMFSIIIALVSYDDMLQINILYWCYGYIFLEDNPWHSNGLWNVELQVFHFLFVPLPFDLNISTRMHAPNTMSPVMKRITVILAISVYSLTVNWNPFPRKLPQSNPVILVMNLNWLVLTEGDKQIQRGQQISSSCETVVPRFVPRPFFVIDDETFVLISCLRSTVRSFKMQHWSL